jgi:hypothetical protein
LENCPGP